MASEAFFSWTGLGWLELTPTRRWSCSIKTNIKTVLGLLNNRVSLLLFERLQRYLRKSEPCGRPSSHEEADALLLV